MELISKKTTKAHIITTTNLALKDNINEKLITGILSKKTCKNTKE